MNNFRYSGRIHFVVSCSLRIFNLFHLHVLGKEPLSFSSFMKNPSICVVRLTGKYFVCQIVNMLLEKQTNVCNKRLRNQLYFSYEDIKHEFSDLFRIIV